VPVLDNRTELAIASPTKTFPACGIENCTRYLSAGCGVYRGVRADAGVPFNPRLSYKNPKFCAALGSHVQVVACCSCKMATIVYFAEGGLDQIEHARFPVAKQLVRRLSQSTAVGEQPGQQWFHPSGSGTRRRNWGSRMCKPSPRRWLSTKANSCRPPERNGRGVKTLSAPATSV